MSSDRDVVIIDGIRTPFVKAGGPFNGVHVVELGRAALAELIARTDLDPSTVDEVVIGNTGSPSDAANVSRVIALKAGLPLSVSAQTTHRNCASALEAIATAFDKIKAGVADVVVAGGAESMSNMPLLFTKEFTDIFAAAMAAKTLGARLSYLSRLKLRHLKPRISLAEGLTDPFRGINMGQTAEVLAKEFHISRADQDMFALRSHQRAIAAKSRLAEEIVPFPIPPKFKSTVEADMGPRENQSLEQLGKLKPYFDRRFGTVTVGNACPITDGAAMVLVTSRAKARELGLKPTAQIRSYAFRGNEPERMGLGPVYATPLALKRAGLGFRQLQRIELNEAFAAQVLACQKAFANKEFCVSKLGLGEAMGEIDDRILNVNGGAIALGHPVGATGTRLVLTLMKEMQRSQSQFGLATLCIGGGQGGAMILESEG